MTRQRTCFTGKQRQPSCLRPSCAKPQQSGESIHSPWRNICHPNKSSPSLSIPGRERCYSATRPRTSGPTTPLWSVSLLGTACRDRRRMDVATHIGQIIGHQVDCHSTYQRNSSHLDRWLVLSEKSTTCMQDGLGTSLQSSSVSDHRVVP